MILDLHSKLSLRNWEKALFRRPFTVEEGWSPKLKNEGLILDLSKVGWIEPAALVRAVLLIEGALLNGANVTLRLPRRKPTQAETTILKSTRNSKDKFTRERAHFTSRAILRRKEAADVLDRMRLREALSHEHLRNAPGSLSVVLDHDWSMQEKERSDFHEQDLTAYDLKPLSTPWYFTIAYGLQWISAPRSAEGKKALDHLAEINVLADMLSHPSGRVLAADGQTLAYVFLKELVENSLDHSEREFALVAAWSRPNTVNIKSSEVLPCERDFANWSKGYPVLEVIVGDSGKGIPATLHDEYDRRGRPCPRLPIDDSENNCILAWAFDKWSSRVHQKQGRGTRGLYRVERIVQKYDGCITLRSELSFVGIDSGSSNPPTFIVESQRLARSPGTAVHVRLPVMISDKVPERRTSPALRQAEFHVLELYDLDWQNAIEAVNYAVERVSEECRRLSGHRRPSCIIADFGFAVMERRTLESLLRELVDIAHPVAIVVANIKGPSWESAFETIHSLSEQLRSEGAFLSTTEAPDALHVHDAILFQHADGRFAWVGIPEEIGSFLIHIWERGDLSREELSELCPDVEQRNRLLRQFAEAYHVAARPADGGLTLRFNKEDIHEQLCRNAEIRVRESVKTANLPAVLHDICRTPSLSVVKSFINVGPLLRRLGIDRTTGVVASKCARLKEVEEAKTIQIVANWRTDRDILDGFKNNLMKAVHRPINIDIHQVSPRDPAVIPEDSLVILFTSVLLTGDSATNLLSQVIRVRRAPALVVAIIDGRPSPEDPLKVLGHSIKTISLARISLLASPSEQTQAEQSRTLINISPLTHMPEKPRAAPRTPYALTTRQLTQLIQDHDALYFDHIVRPNGRHFCFYLDAFKLLGALDTADPTNISRTGRELITYLKKEIDSWFGLKSSIDVICIPNFPRSEKPSAAEIIAKELATTYDAEVQAITPTGDRIPLFGKPSGKSANGLIQNPEQLELLGITRIEARGRVRNMVIVDWGALTGKNLRDSVRFAPSSGVERILVVVLLSHLPADDEQFLSGIRSVNSLDGKAVNDEDGCHVGVKFVGRFPLQAYDRLSCPYCRQIDRLTNEEALFATEFLQKFLEDAKLRLRQRALSEVREERKKSLSVKNHKRRDDADPKRHVAKIAEIRNFLDASRERTDTRHELLLKMSAVEKMAREGESKSRLWRAALIRLLATEWTWLKQEPLNLSSFKAQIAQLAYGQVLDQACSIDSRREAIVVLRTASKERFAKHLPELFRSLVSENELLPQLLYGAFTYLHRDYLVTQSLRPLVDSLSICAKEVREKVGLSVSLPVGRTINALHLFGTYVDNKAKEGVVSTVDSWRFLRNEWADRYDAHHPLADSIRALFLGYIEDDVLDSAKELPDFDWRSIRDSWDLVERHLVQILSWVEPLQPVFEGLEACGVITPEDASNLAVASTHEGLNRMLTLRTQIDMFANGPTSVREFGQWEAFLRERTWFWDVFFNPGGEIRGKAHPPSALLTILKGCPCDFQSILADLLGEANGPPSRFRITTEGLPEDKTLVFCHAVVLDACLRELLTNVTRHATKPKSESLNIHIAVEQSDSLQLRIKNDGVKRKATGLKRGLMRFKQAIQAYGGDLNASEIKSMPNDETQEMVSKSFEEGNSTDVKDIWWLFEAVITIPRW